MDATGNASLPSYHCKVFSYPKGVVEVVTAFVPAKIVEGILACAPRSKRKAVVDAPAPELSEDDKRRSLARARSSVRRLALTLSVDRLLTLTYRENMVDILQAWRHFQRFVRLVRAEYPQWKYVAVPERQKRGAIHFHIGVTGWQDVGFLRSTWLSVVGDGNIDVQAFTRTRKQGGAKAVSIASYISKYMGKGFDGAELRSFGGHRYRASYGIPIVMSAHWLRAESWKEACDETLNVLRLAGVRPGGVMFADDWSVVWAAGWEVEPPF